MRWLMVVLMLLVIACQQNVGERNHTKGAGNSLQTIANKGEGDEQGTSKTVPPPFTEDKKHNRSVTKQKDKEKFMYDEDALVLIGEIEQILSEHDETE